MTFGVQRPLYLATLVACAMQLSCANISLNARSTAEKREQSNDAITGGAKLTMTVFRATAVAAVRQPVTTVKLGIANVWHRPREVVVGNIPVDLVPQTGLEEAPGTWEFEKLLDERGFPRAESGTVEWLVDGPGFFPELDRQIASARRSIDVQVFIFDNDDIAVRYADRLKRRADEVAVRVLFDDLGSTFAHTSAPETPGPRGFVPPADMHGYLEADSKVRARRNLNPWLTCDHTKVLIFDESTAILGGMNIGREYYSEWHDLMIKVEGPVVDTLSRGFRSAWDKAGPLGDLSMLARQSSRKQPSPPPVAGAIPMRVLLTDPAVGRHEILSATLLAIRGAKKRVWIQTPYFSHDDIALACETAARRGVDVRVILPARGDSTIMDAGNLSTANGLIRAGAKVYRFPGMTHMKAMICDDWVCAGSANLDTLSMRINRELNLAFSDRDSVRDLERKVFLPDFRRSKRIREEETQSIGAGLAEVVADQL